MTTNEGSRYAAAGVDIGAKYDAVERAKGAIRETFTPGVLGDVGSFGGLFDPAKVGAEGHVLVASADGVGTKLEVARRAGRYETVGRDLVNHCVDDILVQGARPLFFMDYVAVGRMEPEVVSEVIAGCAEACRENGLALLGGETAEMPGLYKTGDFDLAGFIVGSVARERLLDGSRVEAGQVLLGVGSTGLHTNGYSLARHVMFETLGLALDAKPAELDGATVEDALLAPHRSYLPSIGPLLDDGLVAALAHITGGGLLDNLPRVLGQHDAVIDRSTWEPPALFRFLCDAGDVSPDEAYRVFNMGIGMVVLVDPAHADEAERRMKDAGESVWRIGVVEPGAGAAGPGCVRWA
jgi:phosphoribosylformylglycinamidine cyclo-ligase